MLMLSNMSQISPYSSEVRLEYRCSSNIFSDTKLINITKVLLLVWKNNIMNNANIAN
jgi:hypothetical protein